MHKLTFRVWCWPVRLIVSLPIWQYLRFNPNANRKPDNINMRKGVGYLTEKLEVCCKKLSEAANEKKNLRCNVFLFQLNLTIQL